MYTMHMSKRSSSTSSSHERINNGYSRKPVHATGIKFVKTANAWVKFECFNTSNKADIFEWSITQPLEMLRSLE